MAAKHFAVKINNTNNLQDLLQELYDLANNNYTQIQGEFNKIANTTVIAKLDIDGKEKYGKTSAKYIELIQKCTGQKIEIAKLLTEILKANGNVEKALANSKGKEAVKGLNFKEMRALSEQQMNSEESSDNGITHEKYDIGFK